MPNLQLLLNKVRNNPLVYLQNKQYELHACKTIQDVYELLEVLCVEVSGSIYINFLKNNQVTRNICKQSFLCNFNMYIRKYTTLKLNYSLPTIRLLRYIKVGMPKQLAKDITDIYIINKSITNGSLKYTTTKDVVRILCNIRDITNDMVLLFRAVDTHLLEILLTDNELKNYRLDAESEAEILGVRPIIIKEYEYEKII